eukprot:643914-Rhodomonas_salina.1
MREIAVLQDKTDRSAAGRMRSQYEISVLWHYRISHSTVAEIRPFARGPVYKPRVIQLAWQDHSICQYWTWRSRWVGW